jgi:hypothetical protein
MNWKLVPRAIANRLRGYRYSPVLRCRVCGHTLFPNGTCPNLANDGTHAVDGDGWPER